MHVKFASVLSIAFLCLAGCGNDDGKSMGNGPGNADGIGNRADPPAATTNEASRYEERKESSTTDPNAAMTGPSGTMNDTGEPPRGPAPAEPR